jgi:hypothetical protein
MREIVLDTETTGLVTLSHLGRLRQDERVVGR